MIKHPSLSVLIVVNQNHFAIKSLCSYLKTIKHLALFIEESLPEDLSPYDSVITVGESGTAGHAQHLEQFVQAGGGLLSLVDLAEMSLPGIFGVSATPVGPPSELRVLFTDKDHPLSERMPDAFYAGGRYQGLEIAHDDIETILYADWHYGHTPVLVRRSLGQGHLACTTLQDYANPTLQKILYRLLFNLSKKEAAFSTTNKSLKVGILGYAHSVGLMHGLAINAIDGLELTGVCDLNPKRIAHAREDFPGVKTFESSEDFARDPSIDLVIIATAPNTHAQISLQMMENGKHVVCEKPIALSTKETGSMREMSDKQGVHLSCHQNRRWDVDYLAIKKALDEGLLGDPFYMETFVGGFSHPCGYWHSHDPISGGTAYDWGGHYLDWIVSLIPGQIKAVRGTKQKRVWHDITNTDQERIHILFEGGQEAEFIHSDIAAVRKPKWYILGTEGAIVSSWRDVTEYEIDPVLYYHPHEIPATEMTPDLTLHRRHTSGEIVAQKVAVPKREHYCFHRNLADHLLMGEPLTAPLEDSIRVVAILEAAKMSSNNGCSPEVISD